MDAGNGTYVCTVIYDYDNADGEARAIYVTKEKSVTGILKDINTPAEPGRDVVTVETPQGPRTFPVTPDTIITLKGQACALEDAGKALVAGNVTYVCTIIYDYDNADGEVRAIYIVPK